MQRCLGMDEQFHELGKGTMAGGNTQSTNMSSLYPMSVFKYGFQRNSLDGNILCIVINMLADDGDRWHMPRLASAHIR